MDYTIFETRTIGYHHFADLFNVLDSVNDRFSPEKLELVKDELWKYTFHEVAERYGFSNQMIHAYFSRMREMNFSFDISPYPDYRELQNISLPKYLITSGSEPIQQAKIRALGIESDFIQICYDDRMQGSPGKAGIFTQLIHQDDLDPEGILVIGDNPESEIKAAKNLGLHYVLIDRKGSVDFKPKIQSFAELASFTY
nr:HAD-IA family hydrolase [Fulvivirga sedimenti]